MNFYFNRDILITAGEPPDKLRGELGTYITVGSNDTFEPTSYPSGKIISFSVSPGVRNDLVMFPSYIHTINFYGSEAAFRDQKQWGLFASGLCDQNKSYNDHYFTNSGYESNCMLELNHHDPEYEDLTKKYGTNLLLNYNLINYKFNNEVEKIKLFSSLKSDLEEDPDAPNSEPDAARLLSQYKRRIETFDGSTADLDKGQRFIFKLEKATHFISKKSFPYNFKAVVHPIDNLNQSLIEAMDESNNTKYFMQSIKNDLTFQNSYFYRNMDLSRTKTHNFTFLLNNQNLSQFTEGDDELFLLKEQDLNPNHPSNRFTNQIDRINFLRKYRGILKQASRDYKDILESKSCKTYTLGYKIEKHYLNDQTLPTQTYYSTTGDNQGLVFFDTQLKHGDKYIYKIYHLIGVLGSYYKYSNRLISNIDGDLQDEQGEVQTFSDNDITKKFRARVNVTVFPDFQIFQIPVTEKEIVFYDQPSMPPQVSFYNESGKKNNLLLFFNPNQNSLYDENYVFEPVTSNDHSVAEKLNLSKDNNYGTGFSSDYFSGRYEIYRLGQKPKSIHDFGDNFLTEVDQSTEVLFKNTENQVNATQSGGGYIYVQRDNNASYEDTILPNKKYYYLFRALTYHGTPSNPTCIYEVEIIQGSTGSRVVVEEYKIPQLQTTQCTKQAKRLIKITPNFEQLLFGENHDTLSDSTTDIGILDDHLINGGPIGKKFKVRITSKHTGKKMDINLTFKLKKSNFPG